MNRVDSTNSEIKDKIISKGLALGFDDIGIAAPSSIEGASEHLFEFLNSNFHGEMKWMKEKSFRRSNPKNLWPPVKSIIVVAMSYSVSHNPLNDLLDREKAVFSMYARGDDYHKVFKKKLKFFGRWIKEHYNHEARCFVDTAPVMEKPLAAASGIGWQGKNTNLISKSWGNWLLLGTLFTDMNLQPNIKEKDHCGTCNACQTICPTNAFVDSYKLDARKCISYLLIEYKGHIPIEFRRAIGNRVFGCDDCLAICPWNKFARVSNELSFFPRIELIKTDLAEFVQLDEKSFREIFSGSPVRRLGRERFIRNVLIAIGNSNKKNLICLVKQCLLDSSALVRAMAVWALSCLTDTETFFKLKNENINVEKSKYVIEEWNRR